jgi:hypothetical protein
MRACTGGKGAGATALITSTVVKSVGGAFTISGDYSCPPLFNGISPLVYLIAYASIASSSTNLAGIT